MKKIIFIFLAFIVCNSVFGQLYDPYITNLSFTPASPYGPVNTTGTATFTVGNNGPTAMLHWTECTGSDESCKLIIRISPNTTYTLLGTDTNINTSPGTPTGTIASKFTWTYDSFDGSLKGVQNATIGISESGTIIVPVIHVKISTVAVTSPCNGTPNCYGNFGKNGLVANIEPPIHPTNLNQPSGNDDVGGYVYTNTKLPLEFIDFDAKAIGNKKINLNWKVLNEQNTAQFDVERYDEIAKIWNKIGDVSGIKSPVKQAAYNFVDDVKEISSTKFYYRIKSIENNGLFYYTPARKVSINSNEVFTITSFPNPFKETFMIEQNSSKEGTVTLHIYDILGRMVYNDKYNLSKGYTSKLIDLNRFAAGTFYIHASFDDKQFILNTVKVSE
jgi:Secretion system C-terminal sorting domain